MWVLCNTWWAQNIVTFYSNINKYYMNIISPSSQRWDNYNISWLHIHVSSRCPSHRDPGRIRNARATKGNKEFRRKPDDVFFLWSTGDGRHVDRSRHEFRMHLSGPRATHLSVVQILISRPFEEHSSYSDTVDAHPSRLCRSGSIPIPTYWVGRLTVLLRRSSLLPCKSSFFALAGMSRRVFHRAFLSHRRLCRIKKKKREKKRARAIYDSNLRCESRCRSRLPKRSMQEVHCKTVVFVRQRDFSYVLEREGRRTSISINIATISK